MNKAVAEIIQAMWKDNLNVNVELLNQETKVYLDARNQGNFPSCSCFLGRRLC